MRQVLMRGSLIVTGIAHACTESEGPPNEPEPVGRRTIEKVEIGRHYDTAYATLWKDGTYFPRGTRVLVSGLHLEQGFCVRFPAEVGGEPLETWEDWDEIEFLAEEGSVEEGDDLPSSVLSEAREVLDNAEDGCHLHLHEGD
jgi:hypothetical protein